MHDPITLAILSDAVWSFIIGLLATLGGMSVVFCLVLLVFVCVSERRQRRLDRQQLVEFDDEPPAAISNRINPEPLTPEAVERVEDAIRTEETIRRFGGY